MSSDVDADADGGGYVHRPADRDDRSDADADGVPDATGDASPAAGEFGRSGWALVAAVLLSVLIAPGAIYLYPAAPGNLGLSFFAAMLALPFLPALVLGLTAVWSMTAATESE